MQEFPEVKNRKFYLTVIVNRLAFLHRKKQETKRAKGTCPTYFEEDIDSMFWILAHYEMMTGYNVASELATVEGISVVRYRHFLEILKSRKEFVEG